MKYFVQVAGVEVEVAIEADGGVRVDGELVPAVLEATRRGPEQGVRRQVGRAEDLAPTLPPAAVVVTNPPRTGMDSRVIDAIAAARPRSVAYISCDPATLARDLGRLIAAWQGAAPLRLTALRAFDLFPQTAHVETVAIVESDG